MNRLDWLNLTFLTALALAVRFYDLSGASLWLDEVLTIKLASLPLSTLWVSAYDPTPPLYYSIIKSVLYFGHSAVWLRFPSALFGGLTVAVMYVAARKLSGSITAFATGLLLTLSLFGIEYGQEARAYALMGFCLAVSFLGLVTLTQRWRDSTEDFDFPEFIRRGAGFYALGLVAALYSHNAAVFYWLAVQLFFLVLWARPFSFSGKLLAAWFVVNTLVLILWLPWLMASIEIMSGSKFSWLGHYNASQAFRIWRGVHGMHALEVVQPWVDIALLALAVLGLLSLRRRPALLILLLSLLLFSSIAMWAWGLFASPVYMLRTILWGSMFSALLVGIGIGCLPRYVAFVTLVLVGVGGAVSTYRYFDTNQAQSEDFRSAAAVFEKKRGPDDILLFRSRYISRPFLYYIGDYPPDMPVYGWSCNKERASRGRLERDSLGLLQAVWEEKRMRLEEIVPASPSASLWLVESHCHMKDPVRANRPIERNWRSPERYEFQFVRVYRLRAK